MSSCQKQSKRSPGSPRSLLSTEWHRWKAGLKPEELKQILDFYQQRYKQ